MTSDNKAKWSKIYIPPELADLLYMIARKQGYKREHIHRFVYDLLNGKYPEDVENLSDFIGQSWLRDSNPDSE